VNMYINRSKVGVLRRAEVTPWFAAPSVEWRRVRARTFLACCLTWATSACSDGHDAPNEPSLTSTSSAVTTVGTDTGATTGGPGTSVATSAPSSSASTTIATEQSSTQPAGSTDEATNNPLDDSDGAVATEPSTPDTNTTDAASTGVTSQSGETSDMATASAGEPTMVIDEDALFAAPSGSANAPGTLSEPTTLASAVSKVSSGGTIYLRGGTYALSSTVALAQDGTSAAPITLRAYPADDTRPKLDFSAMSEDSSNRGLTLSGDYWYIYGVDVFDAGDNGMFVSGSHNKIEHSTFSECADTGLQLGNGAADNLVLNCDSFFNADSSLENADGFAAKLDVGSGNKFVGCRAWNNLDDGWDGYLRPADNVTTTYENCWAIDNGKLKDGSVGAGDGNGFKTGGSDDKDLRHHASYTRCIAAGNVSDGFDHNSNRGNVTLLNCAAHDNGSNINFGSSNIAASLTIKNTISLGDLGSLEASSTDITNNSWQDGRSATNDDFESVDRSLLKSPRKSDGSLPDIDYLGLTAGSDLRNAGVDVGLPYKENAPDLGAFE
jgi:hypothetical protein